jgi:hypothetical protein
MLWNEFTTGEFTYRFLFICTIQEVDEFNVRVIIARVRVDTLREAMAAVKMLQLLDRS